MTLLAEIILPIALATAPVGDGQEEPRTRCPAGLPVTINTELESGPRSSGIVQLHVTLDTPADELSTEVVFRLRAPGEPIPENAPGEIVPAGLSRDQPVDLLYEFTPGVPGQYVVYIVARSRDAYGSRRAFERPVAIDVAADGTTHLGDPAPEVEPEPLGDGPHVLDLSPAARECGDLPRYSPPAGSRASSFKVRGRFRYTDRTYLDGAFTGTAVLPVRFASISVLEIDGGTPVLSLDYGETDKDGYFTLTVSDNFDGFGEGGRDLRLKMTTANDRAGVRRTDGVTLHGITYGDFNDWSGQDLDIGTVDISLLESGQFNIFDVALKALDFIKAKGEPGRYLDIWWTRGVDTGNTSYYSRAQKVLHINGGYVGNGPDEFDDDVILHEVGHSAMQAYSYDRSPGGTHYLDSTADARLAWSEGWATYFAGMVDYNRYYVDHTSTDLIAYSLEANDWNALGDGSEVSVTGALWDIYDGHSDGMDTLSDGSANSWNVFTNSFNQYSRADFRDFYDGWRALNLPNFSKVDQIARDHGIDYTQQRVTFPNSSANVATIGRNFTIKWKSFPAGDVGIDLYRDGAYAATASAAVPNTGSRAWTPPPGLPTGDGYRVRVYSVGSPGHYDESDQPFRVYPATTTLTVGGAPKAGSISSGVDQDWYSFNVTSQRSYTISTSAGTLTDNYMWLHGPNSQVPFLAEDDDSGAGSMARIVRTLNPGTYYVLVQGFEVSDTGTYTIQVTQ